MLNKITSTYYLALISRRKNIRKKQCYFNIWYFKLFRQEPGAGRKRSATLVKF